MSLFALAALSDALLSNDRDVFDAVLDHAVFDPLYSLVKCVRRRGGCGTDARPHAQSMRPLPTGRL